MLHGLDIYMVFGCNPINIRVKLLRGIFFVINKISKIISNKRCYTIESIKFVKDKYIVTYFYRRERFVLTNSADEILQSSELINKFDSQDATIIGFCVSNPSQHQFKDFRRYFNNYYGSCT